MSLQRMKKGNEYVCGSCARTITDFRDKSTEEIVAAISEGVHCGIFRVTQVRVPEFTFRYRFMFRILATLALLGLNVKPLNAQEKKNKQIDPDWLDKKTVRIDQHGNEEKNKKPERGAEVKQKPPRKTWWRVRKKKEKEQYFLGLMMF